MGGLEVKDPISSQYVPVPPQAGTLVANVGDMLHRWSNGVLKSTYHRVVPPKPRIDANGHPYIPERFSLPFVRFSLRSRDLAFDAANTGRLPRLRNFNRRDPWLRERNASKAVWTCYHWPRVDREAARDAVCLVFSTMQMYKACKLHVYQAAAATNCVLSLSEINNEIVSDKHGWRPRQTG